MIKKISLLVLALLLVLSFVSCDTAGGDETTESSSSDTSGETDPEAYTPEWHLSETVNEELYISFSDYAVMIPHVEYEENVDDFLFHINFFEEFYPVGSMMQYRLSITNNTGEDVIYDAKSTIATIQDGRGQSVSFETIYPGDISYYADNVDHRVFAAGETIVFEGAVRVSAFFFTPKTCTFGFDLVRVESGIRRYSCFTYTLSVVNRYEQ